MSPRRAAVVIATATGFTTVAAAVVISRVDREDFPTTGSGLWWAIQTVTTVGYGDHVPTSAAGRVVATIVMLFGIGFLTVITASITGGFVERSRRDRLVEGNPAASAEQLRKIDERLERIEAALSERF